MEQLLDNLDTKQDMGCAHSSQVTLTDENDAHQECVVCYEGTANLVRPCFHRVCPECIDKWVSKDQVSCPLCRGIVVNPRKHLPVPALKVAGREATVTVVDFPCPNSHAGVTFSSDPRGLKVSGVHAADRAHACGLRHGDVVVLLNGMTVTDHAVAARLMTRAAETREPVAFSVVRKRWWNRWRGASLRLR